MTITKQQIAESTKLAAELRAYMQPIVIQWVENCQRAGVDDNVIRMSLSAEALVLAGFSHIGNEELFLRMARAAIGFDQAARENSDGYNNQPTTH